MADTNNIHSVKEDAIEERKWCVYIHRCKINNKVYIGIAKGNPAHRWGNNGRKYRKNSQPVFYNAIQKYKWDGFEHIVWAINLEHDEAKHMEQILIALFKTNCRRYKNPSFGYNETDGGDGSAGRKVSEETKAKLSLAHKGKVLSDEQKEKIRQSLIGRPGATKGRRLSQEIKDKMSKSHTGMRFTDEHRKNLSIANQKETAGFHNHRHTEEAKQKQREATIARNATLEWKINNKLKLAKPIVQFGIDGNIIKVWNCIKDAASALHIYPSGIIRCCRGVRQSAEGYQWRYLYDQTHKDDATILGAITLGLITEEEALAQLNTRQND